MFWLHLALILRGHLDAEIFPLVKALGAWFIGDTISNANNVFSFNVTGHTFVLFQE